jgi:hypothetical protein
MPLIWFITEEGEMFLMDMLGRLYVFHVNGRV